MAKLTITRPLLDLLAQRQVHHRRFGGERWQVGQPIYVDERCALEPYVHVFEGVSLPRAMGAFSYSQSPVADYVEIGRYGSIAGGVTWLGGPHPIDWATTSPFPYDRSGALPGLAAYRAAHPDFDAEPAKPFVIAAPKVRLGHDVWIGEEALIGRDVVIGDGAVVAARAVVTRDVAPYAIVGGAPARVIRMRFPEPLAERLLAAAWWRYPPEQLQPLPIESPERFLDGLAQAEAAGRLKPMAPRPLRFAEIAAAASAG